MFFSVILAGKLSIPYSLISKIYYCRLVSSQRTLVHCHQIIRKSLSILRRTGVADYVHAFSLLVPSFSYILPWNAFRTYYFLPMAADYEHSKQILEEKFRPNTLAACKRCKLLKNVTKTSTTSSCQNCGESRFTKNYHGYVTLYLFESVCISDQLFHFHFYLTTNTMAKLWIMGLPCPI